MKWSLLKKRMTWLIFSVWTVTLAEVGKQIQSSNGSLLMGHVFPCWRRSVRSPNSSTSHVFSVRLVFLPVTISAASPVRLSPSLMLAFSIRKSGRIAHGSPRTPSSSSNSISDNYRWDFAHGVAPGARPIKPAWQQNFARDYHHFLSAGDPHPAFHPTADPLRSQHRHWNVASAAAAVPTDQRKKISAPERFPR